jgi:hypothetical protein
VIGHIWRNLAVLNAADDDYVLTTANMANGAYALTKTDMPTSGARKLSVIRTVTNASADTPGTITVVGRALSGQSQTEIITPGANGVTVWSTKFYAGTVSLTQAGWVVGGADPDTIIVGVGIDILLAEGPGHFGGLNVNTTAAGAITIADSTGTIAILPANVAVGYYRYDVNYSNYLKVTQAANTDATYYVTSSFPTNYSM